VNQDELPWGNVIDHRGEVRLELNITALPVNYLIDCEGKIIGKNLSLEKIEALLNARKKGKRAGKTVK